MTEGKHIAMFGGDARQLEVVRFLQEAGAQLSLYGFDQLDTVDTSAVKKSWQTADLSNTDAVLLPVSGIQLNGTIESMFSNERVELSLEALKQTPAHCKVFTGIANDTLVKLCHAANRTLIPILDRDDVAIFNSIPTAEGAVMMVIQNTDYTIHSSKVAVLGWGRTGITVARTFHALGANVFVGARSSSHLARIEETGYTSFHTSDMQAHLNDVNICINTIPDQMLTKDILQTMSTNTLIIDLASKPGGTDFKYAEELGLKAILAPGLPGIVAPKTAGQILAKILSQLLQQNDEEAKGEVS
ncbi:dipicolinic acid synthetase subunit A [Aureibacillus halotolerans]|uniref:Dipicolinate synthase subunit A n=1 Tax=Aureibacillus halotolerans TaxID=1508390 RepID=A0A4V3D5E0_9BACI|nr:dipicolinic acid synthetase subunit A [Aureibacillus halotolerans]TDQ39697.1 dipicolinate synthase subunit A [Aureibacillus halotolerans]